MTVRESLRDAEQALRDARIHLHEVDARILLAHALGETLSRLPLLFPTQMPPGAAQVYAELVRRRADREPLAYILGRTEFMGLPLTCDPRVLVPRPDTEVLVETVIRLVRRHDPPVPEEPVIAEIGTGSGCIAVALTRFLPRARLVATDLSPGALEVARANIAANGVADRVALLHGDGLEPLVTHGWADRVDVLVSNPPYIPGRDIEILDPEVAWHEPRLAVFGGDDGLDMYRRLLAGLHLLPRLKALAFEFGFDQHEPLTELVRGRLPGWTVAIHKDLADFERVILAVSPV